MENILAISLIFGGGTLFLLSVSPIGRAIGDRIRSRGGTSDQRVRLLQENQDALMDEVDSLRSELADVQERIDFTERLLAQGRTENAPPSSVDVQD